MIMDVKKIEEYLFTLEVCKRFLPPDTNPVHYERLRDIEQLLLKLLKEK